MTLRTPNIPLPEPILLSALVPILPTGTALAAGSLSRTGTELCYVEQKYALSQGPFPAVLLSSGPQEYHRNSRSTYTGTFTAYIDYYDRWDSQSGLTIDTIRADILLELERMASNVETYLKNNEGFAVGGTVYPVGFPSHSIGGYLKGNDPTFPAMIVGTRRLSLTFTILPYGV